MPVLESPPTPAAGSPAPGPRPAAPTAWRHYAAVGLVAVALGALVLVAAPSVLARFQPHLYSGSVLQGSQPAPTLDGMRYTTGEPVDLDALRGDVVLVYFGYTNCPDECPATLAAAARAVASLDAGQRSRTRVMMVTVDNAHDDAPTLDTYVRAFDPDFRGVLGADEVTARVASLYGVYFEPASAGGDDAYTIDHTTSLVGIGTDGALRVVWPPNVTDEALAADVAALLE